MIDTNKTDALFTSEKVATYLWFLALALFMVGVWKQPFINFETRFAVFAQEMLRHGLTLFPTTYGHPYPDYPVTSTVLIWLFSLPFGEVTKFSAVLPTALASATVVALTYRLFALYSARWGLLAVAFELVTVTFLAESRSLSIDQMVSAVTLAAFYVTHRAYLDRQRLPKTTLLLLLVSGFLVRGPIGVVLPTGVVLSHLVCTHRRQSVITFGLASLVVLVACTVAQLGLAALLYGQDFVADIIRMQAVSRFAEAEPSPRYYYFVNSLGNYALSYPVALAVAAATLWNRFMTKHRTASMAVEQERSRTLVLLLLAWVAIVFVGLSIPETKKARYVLPAVPALAGLAAYLFIDRDSRLLKRLRHGVEGILFLLPLLATVFLQVKRAALHAYGFEVLPSQAVLGALFLLGIALFAVFRRKADIRAVGFLFVGVLTTIYINTVIVEPIDLRIHDTSAFVRSIESLRERQPGTLVFYKEGQDSLPIKYLVNARTDLSPEFVADPEALKRKHSARWLLAKEKYAEELSAAGIDMRSDAHRQRFGDIPFIAVFVPAAPPP